MNKKVDKFEMMMTMMRMNDDDDKLDSVLCNPRELQSFMAYAVKVHSHENVLFLLAVKAFKEHNYATKTTNSKLDKLFKQHKIGEPEYWRQSFKKLPEVQKNRLESTFKVSVEIQARIYDALKIFRYFLNDQAPYWVFVSPHLINDLLEKIKGDISLFNQSVFDDIAREVQDCIQVDAYSRYMSEDCSRKTSLTAKKASSLRMPIAKRLLQFNSSPAASCSFD